MANVNLSIALSSISNEQFVRPSSEQIWQRIYGRMLTLHPELAYLPPSTHLQETQVVDYFQPFNCKQSEPASEIPGEEPLIFIQDTHRECHFQHFPKMMPSRNVAGGGSCSEEVWRVPLENLNAQDTSPMCPCPLSSIRLPPIDQGRISPSGRKALKKLRGEIAFQSC